VTSREPDWWLASDGRWYPGHLHPWRQQPGQHAADPAQPVSAYAPTVVVVSIVLIGALVAGTVSAVTGGPGSRPRAATGRTTPTSTSPQLTAALTTQVVRNVWAEFTNAAAEDDVPGMLAVASRPVAQVMEARFVCLCQPWPSSYSSLEVTAPTEHSYPLSFFAEIDQPDNSTGPETQLAVFTDQDRTAHWMITYLSSYGGDDPMLDLPSALDAPVATDPPQATSFEQLASMFESLRQSGKPPAGNPWDWTISDSGHQPSDFADDLIDSHQTDTAFHIVSSVSYTVSSYSPSFSISLGDISCAMLTVQMSLRPAHGSFLVQPSTEGAVGSLLPSGDYSSVAEQGSVDLCLVKADGTTEVQGVIGGLYNADGVPYP
jgi:hypothetical protein